MKMLTDYPKWLKILLGWLEGWLKRDFELPQVGARAVVDFTSQQSHS